MRDPIYLIHACPQRMWYVHDYLLPSLSEQGVESIVWEDKEHKGNLTAFLESVEFLSDTFSGEESVWHIQDDVIVSRDFSRKTNQHYEEDVICGFSNCSLDNVNDIIVQPEKMWWSFPCVMIRNFLHGEFLEWVDWSKKNDFFMSMHIRMNRYDDFIFKHFLLNNHHDMNIRQMIPNLVDHVDHLIGGSILDDREEWVRSRFFQDRDLVEDLEHELSKGGKHPQN